MIKRPDRDNLRELLSCICLFCFGLAIKQLIESWLRKTWQQTAKAGRREQEAGWSEYIHIQEADSKQEVGPGIKDSRSPPVTRFL